MKLRRGYPLAAAAALILGGVLWRPASLRAQQALEPEERRGAIAMARQAGEGRDAVGEVLVNGQVALRIREPAGGLTPGQRAEIVARRLNELAAQGRLEAENLAVRPIGGITGVYAGQELIITADRRHARANATTTTRLAETWRENLSTALTGRVAGFRQEIAVPELEQKLVPIVTFGSAGSIGIAQVTGPEDRVREVRAVAQIATDYQDRARIRALVPIHTENIVEDLRRVPQVAVTGVAGIRL